MNKLVVCGLWLVGSTVAAQEQEGFDDPALNERYRALIHEVRCPKCLNESIGESKAPVAASNLSRHPLLQKPTTTPR